MIITDEQTQMFVGTDSRFIYTFLRVKTFCSKFAQKPHTMTRHSQTSRRNIATVLAHTLFIIMLFVLPELVMAIASPHRPAWGFYPGFYIKAFFYLAVFYANYFGLVDRTLGLQKPRIVRFVLLNIVLVALSLTLNYMIGSILYDPPRPRHWESLTDWQRLAKMTSWILRDAVMMVLAIGLAVAMRLSTRWADIQLQKQKLLATQRSTELENLKSQLNPHFLFNTLNSIYALIDIDSEDAKSAVHKLSGMLRYMLYEDEAEVPLAREADFIDNYVSLMRLRMSTGNHPLEVDISVSGPEATVPPLLFIPLVENAFKYGITAPAGLPVCISLHADSDGIHCSTANGFASGDRVRKGGGIGLANLRRRLVLIYGNSATLRTQVGKDMFRAELTLPLRVPEISARNLTDKTAAQ